MFTDDTESFFGLALGPDVATTGAVVFDVPPAALAKNSEVCFGELGFGSRRRAASLFLFSDSCPGRSRLERPDSTATRA